MFGNPARGPRIVQFGGTRSVSDRLANGRPAFRVTQTFDALDAYWKLRGKRVKHGAIDIGNGYCGDEITAMIEGTVAVIQDESRPPANGVRITRGNLVCEVWHLSRAVVRDGQYVRRGQLVGYNGQSGLNIGGCHTHVKTSTDGGRTWVDPWPLLDQNRKTVNPPTPKPRPATPAPSQEDQIDMGILQSLSVPADAGREFDVNAGVVLRTGPGEHFPRHWTTTVPVKYRLLAFAPGGWVMAANTKGGKPFFVPPKH